MFNIKRLMFIILVIALCIGITGCAATVTEEDYVALQQQLKEQIELNKQKNDEISDLATEKIALQEQLEEKDEDIASKEKIIASVKEQEKNIEKQLEDMRSENEKHREKYDELLKNFEHYTEIVGQTEDAWIATQKSSLQDLPVYDGGYNELVGYGDYRMAYYDSALILGLLNETRGYCAISVDGLSEKEFESKYFDSLFNYVMFKGEEPEECLILTAIKQFRITREEMEQIVELCKGYGNTEPPNVDILYTFDQDIINEYYRCA